MKTYRVLSNAPVEGTAKGETFTADLPESQEKRMVGRGSIEVVTDSPASKTDSPPEVPPVAEEPTKPEGDKSGKGSFLGGKE